MYNKKKRENPETISPIRSYPLRVHQSIEYKGEIERTINLY
jgi:hypothetical protein